MDISKFEQLFHPSWWIKFKPFFESKEFEVIWEELKSRGQRGKTIYPYSLNLKKKDPDIENCIFRAFKETSLDALNVIFLGLSPYYTMYNGKVVADGLAFSTKTKKEPPSLQILYNEIEKDIYGGLNLNMIRNPDLSFLANQGVLLLNAALTCEDNMSEIHLKLWEPFINYLFKEIINKGQSGLHIVFWGEAAQKYAKLIQKGDEETLPFDNFHYLYEENHPSFFARSGKEMNTTVFSTINKRLKDYRGFEISWDESDLQKPPF